MQRTNLARRARQTVDRARAKVRPHIDYLRKLRRRHGRGVVHQLIRGTAYGFGSGAVSLLIIWWQNHH